MARGKGGTRILGCHPVRQLIQHYAEFSSGLAYIQRSYHVIVGNEKKVLWGSSIGYYATKRANVFAGYDNANALFAGVKFIL